MLLYIGNLRWTIPSKARVVHICGIDRRPLCKKKYSNGALDVYDGEIEDVTCDSCKKELLVALKNTKDIVTDVEKYLNK